MKSFSTEEVNRVIKRALLLRQRIGISREDLLEIGRELGLKSEAIEAALLQEMADKSKETAERDWRQGRGSPVRREGRKVPSRSPGVDGFQIRA